MARHALQESAPSCLLRLAIACARFRKANMLCTLWPVIYIVCAEKLSEAYPVVSKLRHPTEMLGLKDYGKLSIAHRRRILKTR